MKIPIFQIKVSEGRREKNPEAVHELADSISKVGLLNPITVDQSYSLIAGLHRLEAAKMLGWTEIECTVSSLEGLMAELAEIDENFVRKGLSEIEYGDLLLRRKEIYETLHPETKQGMRNGQTSKNRNLRFLEPKPFSVDTAEKTGVSRATIERQVQAAQNMTPEAKKIIRGANTKISKTNALKLSRLEPEQQKEAATQLVAGDIRSVDDYHPASVESAVAEGQEPEVPPDTEPAAPMPVPPPPVIPPTSGDGYYATIKDSVADLKNPDKDRRCTPDNFLVTFSYFLQRFCQSMENYTGPEYDEVLPVLTQDHLALIHQKIQYVHTALDELFNKIEGKVQHETT